MNVKTLFKTVFSTAVLVLLLLMGWHNRTPIDFNLLPVSTQSFHGPIALMCFAFFGVGVLTGLVISIRSGRKQEPSSSSSGNPTAAAPIRMTSEPTVGSRIS